MISFFVHGLAETKGSWRALGKGRVIPDNPRAKAWEQAVAWMARLAWNKAQKPSDPPYPHPVTVRIAAFLPELIDKRRDRDVDKLARAALDAMQGIIYANDKQVAELTVDKLRIPGRPIGMLVMVSECPSDVQRAHKYDGMTALPLEA